MTHYKKMTESDQLNKQLEEMEYIIDDERNALIIWQMKFEFYLKNTIKLVKTALTIV